MHLGSTPRAVARAPEGPFSCYKPPRFWFRMEGTMRLPDGWHTLTPRIVVQDVAGLVQFLRQVFDATGEVHADQPAVMKIGDSVVMVSGLGPREGMPAFLYLYVDDSGATYRHAGRAGAQSLEEPSNTPYGDRRGMVQDRWGNVWQIATPKNDVGP